MKRKEVEIKNKLGLHARPASLLVKLAGKYSSEIDLIKEEKYERALKVYSDLLLLHKTLVLLNYRDRKILHKKL